MIIIITIILTIIFLILLISFINTLIKIDTQIKNEFELQLSGIISDLNQIYKDKYELDVIQQKYLKDKEFNVDKLKKDYINKEEELITPYLEAKVIKVNNLITDKLYPIS